VSDQEREREQAAFREAFRARLRQKRTARVIELDAEAAALVAVAATRTAPAVKSYVDPDNWAGKGKPRKPRSTYVERPAGERLTEADRRARSAEGTRAYHQRLHEDLVARGEKACRRCELVLPLSRFSERSLASGRPGWHPYCRECQREMYREGKGAA
jgi:hypothetical protein